MKILLKTTLGLLALAALGLLFVRSLQSTREAPFSVAREDLTGWTLALEAADHPLGALLTLRPQAALMPPLHNELFSRVGESLSYPPAAMPLVLHSEFEGALDRVFTPEALLAAARATGLESEMPTPRCMAGRRVSAPGVLRGAYFLVLELPAFDRFREQVAQQLQGAGGDVQAFDPAALSPVLLAADLDGGFRRWFPLRANLEADCFAPIEIE